jgi:hypothetical protein
MTYWSVSVEKHKWFYEHLGIIHGDKDAIIKYYAAKGKEVMCKRMLLINVKGTDTEGEAPYASTIWRWPTQNQVYSLGKSQGEAKTGYRLYCIQNALTEYDDDLPVISVPVSRLSVQQDGTTEIV